MMMTNAAFGFGFQNYAHQQNPGRAQAARSGAEEAQDAAASNIDAILAGMTGMGGDDIIFQILASQVREADQRATQQIKSMDLLKGMRQSIDADITKARRLMQVAADCAKAVGDDEYVAKYELASKLYDPSAPLKHWTDYSGGEQKHLEELVRRFEKEYGNVLFESEYKADPKTGSISVVPDHTKPVSPKEDGNLFSKDAFEKVINRLTQLAQKIDTDREIENIRLNQFVNRKSQTVELLSNLIKKQNDTSGAIIQNFR
ncbi:MAG: hypothetical protein IT371_15180 [Deltaproteobacteria bacterium]|nr:hypothetical protein [Deltaproteobacteria bacterium]